MKEQTTIAGRSLILNIIFIVINLLGLAFVTAGYHESAEDSSTLFKSLGFGLMSLTIIGLFFLKGRKMMSSVSRILVGGLFIVSGLVKANDPIGFAYKLEEYFEDGALAFRIKEWFGMPDFSLEFFIEYALLLSVIICIAEIVLGVLVIIGGKIKLVSYSMLLMMIFFTFLTWHTSNCDASIKFLDRDTYEMVDPVAQIKIDESAENDELTIVSQDQITLVVDEMKQPQCVDDCGCFGDALKGSVGRSLTPQESMWKDLILLYLVIWIFAAQWIIAPNSRKENVKFVGASLVVILFFSFVFGWYFPLLFGTVSLLGGLWVLRTSGKFFGNYYGVAMFVTLLCSLMVWYVVSYLPLKDYRPYAEGSNLVEKMNDGIEGVYESLLVYKNIETGETHDYSSTSKEYTDSKIWENKKWKYESMIQNAIIPTKIPSITDQFNPFIATSDVSSYELELGVIYELMKKATIEGLRVMNLSDSNIYEVPLTEYNVTDYDLTSYSIIDTLEMKNPAFTELSIRDVIVDQDRFVFVSSKNLLEGDWRSIETYKEIFEECKRVNIPFVVICNGSRDDINKFREEHKFYAPFLVNDETELKAITRSNPSLLIIEKGTVQAKYPFRSTPSKDKFIRKHTK